MAYLRVSALLLFLLGVVVMHCVTGCIEELVSPWEVRAGRERVQRQAKEIIRQLEEEHGDTPLEKWSAGHQEVYRIAKARLEEGGQR